jgi:hypothetical protein
MRDGLADYCCMMHLAHINPTNAESRRGWNQRLVWKQNLSFGSIRSTSRSFTTRLVLVIASWTDQNILRTETVQDALVARIQKISRFFSTSKQYFNNCIKRLKCLEVLLGTFGESVGTEPVTATETRKYMGGDEILPLSNKGTLARRKLSKIFRTKPHRLVPTSTSIAGKRLVSRLCDRFAAHRTRP